MVPLLHSMTFYYKLSKTNKPRMLFHKQCILLMDSIDNIETQSEFYDQTHSLFVYPQYPGVAQSINSDVNNLMTVLNISNALPEGELIFMHANLLSHTQKTNTCTIALNFPVCL